MSHNPFTDIRHRRIIYSPWEVCNVALLNWLVEVNERINHVVWMWLGLTLLLITGVWMSLRTGFFQVRYGRHWLGQTLGQLRRRRDADNGSISPFQALCTTLAASIGVGNIAGVATAIVIGGPGSVFWMWVAALLGMMTGYAESVLGIYYRRRGKDGWLGGAMYYIRDGLKGTVGRVTATLFAAFMALASFGIGNMAQVNAIATHLQLVFPSPALSEITVLGDVSLYGLLVGLLLTAVVSGILRGGLQRTARVAEVVVPPMVIVFTLGSLAVIGIHHHRIDDAVSAIFRYAFSPDAVWGAGGGIALKQVITCGFKRGTFSNEAGMGSSVAVHANAHVTEPVQQGMWSIFQVFVDTIVMCTVTALVVLVGGDIDLTDGSMLTDAPPETLVSQAFGAAFGSVGEGFVALAVVIFAFTTILGWSQYGATAAAYLGEIPRRLYRPLFLSIIPLGAVISGDVAFSLCDTFNGLMMLPNLVTLLYLSGTVKQVTDNYIRRRIRREPIAPMISYHPRIQRQMMHDDTA